MRTDTQSKHVLKLLHFTETHVERRRLKAPGHVVTIVHVGYTSPLQHSELWVTRAQRGTLTRNVTPSLSQSEHLTASLVHTNTTQTYRRQLTFRRADIRREEVASKGIS